MGPSSRYISRFGLALFAFLALLTIVLFGAGAAQGETITLTSDDKGKVDLLTNALANVTDGDRILLSGGLFFEKGITIDKEITVEGENEVYLVTKSVHITADNVTMKGLSVTMDPGFMEIDGDNWLLDRVVLQECVGKTCLKTVGTRNGRLQSSTLIGANQDALQVSWMTGLTMNDCFLYAPYVAMRMDNVTGLEMYNVRAAQSYIGLYLSWSTNVSSSHSVYDTKGWGMLIANSTNVTVDDTLMFSSGGSLSNYGLYLAFGTDISVENCTFSSDAAGLSLYKSENVTVRWNSIFGNIEGVWCLDSTYEMQDNAVFNNLRANLNTSGGGPKVTGNYWGTTSIKTARSMVRGDAVIEPIRLSDTTPDEAPKVTSNIPDSLTSMEDAASDNIYDVGAHFSDDTWYTYAYIPSPSKVKFEVIYNSDPENVTLRISEDVTCSGSCPDVEGELRVSTAQNWYGEVRVKIRGYDWRGKFVDSNTFRIKFTPSNDRPTLSVKDVPKNSLVEVGTDEKKDFVITVFDDSDTVYLETRIDEGDWERVEGDLLCAQDNSTRSRDLPRCSDKVLRFDAPDDLLGGRHIMAFRTCDGEFCSDDVYTGNYEIEIEYEGREGKAFSMEGAMVALVLLLFALVLAYAVMPRKGKRERPKSRAGPRKDRAEEE